MEAPDRTFGPPTSGPPSSAGPSQPASDAIGRSEPRFLRAGEHRFEHVYFYIPTTCRQCGDWIWSFTKGAECKDCHYSAHLDCAPNVAPECAVRLRRTRREHLPSARKRAIAQRQETFNRHNITKEGMLLKMALADGTWSACWCVLKGETLYVFRLQKTEIEYTVPILNISLKENQHFSVAAISSLPQQHCFVVYTDKRDYYFAASSEDEKRAWIHEIKNSRKKIEYSPDTQKEIYEPTTKELMESWLCVTHNADPRHFAWEDISTSRMKLISVRKLMEERNVNRAGLVPELQVPNPKLVGLEEIQYFRLKIARVFSVQDANERVRLINTEITDAPVPANFPQVFLALFRFGRAKYRIHCKPDKTMFELIRDELLMRVHPIDMSVSWAVPRMEDYVVKVGGCNEYLFDLNVKISSLAYVRDCINKVKEVEFDLVEYEPLKSKVANRHNKMNDAALLMQSYRSIESEERLGFETETFPCFDIADITKAFEMKVCRVENFGKELLQATNKFLSYEIESNSVSLFVVAGLYYGGELIAPLMYTQPVPCNDPVWDEWISSETIRMCDVPRETRLCFAVYACLSDNGGTLAKLTKLLRGGYTEFVPLGWVNYNWADFRGVVCTGIHKLHLWPSTSGLLNPLGTCGPNFDSKALALVVEFDSSSPRPVVYPPYVEIEVSLPHEIKEPSQQSLQKLERIIHKDALCSMTKEEKKLVWRHRYFLRKNAPHSLPKILLAVPWHVPSYVQEAHKLISSWPRIHPIQALELLDVRFPDTQARRYAVQCLRDLTDRELVEFLPQLVQVLRSEPYHYCSLSEFLLLRAVKSIVVGHPFFWHLKAEAHTPNIAVRFRLMVEAFLLGCGDDDIGIELRNELEVVGELARIAMVVKQPPTPETRTVALREELNDIALPNSFLLPNSPKLEVSRLVVDKCRVMDSFTKPLWVVFENSEKRPMQIIFKVGDDLRTDILALQMMRIMDGLWRNEGLDLHMQPYRAACTGDGQGVIEVITDSQTTSTIQQTYGGGGPISAFSTTALRDWLRACNPTERAHEEAIRNFTLSCAGYCVATYILGIGDRHNDNIMCSYRGNMFHIDFGYFLGQRVTFAGIPRETTPFVLTPDFALAMGGENSKNFKRFVNHCCRAYNIIRKHGHLFVTLFVLMLSAGIPQLRGLEDLYYLRDALALDLTEEEASARFRELVHQSLHNQMTQINNMVHIHFHPKNG